MNIKKQVENLSDEEIERKVSEYYDELKPEGKLLINSLKNNNKHYSKFETDLTEEEQEEMMGRK